MEIRTYLNGIFRAWWLVLLVTILGGAAMAFLDRSRVPIYHTTARVVVRPSPNLPDPRTVIDLTGSIGGRYIPGTFAQLFTAAQIKTRAAQIAGITPEQANNYDIEAVTLPDTVVIQVSADGPDPPVLAAYLNATVQATVEDTRALFGVMELASLEQAHQPRTPVSPQPVRDVPLGAGLGLGVGIVLALLLDWLRGLRRAGREAPAPAASTPQPIP